MDVENEDVDVIGNQFVPYTQQNIDKVVKTCFYLNLTQFNPCALNRAFKNEIEWNNGCKIIPEVLSIANLPHVNVKM